MSDSSEPRAELQGLERKILEYIAKGININSWLMDALGNIDGREFQRLVDRLKADGYVLQKGELYLDKVTYELTEYGRESLPPLPEEDREMLAEYGLDYDSVTTLDSISRIDKKAVQLDDIVAELDSDTDYQKALIEKLSVEGYITFKGVLVPKIVLTEKGEDIVRRFQHRDR